MEILIEVLLEVVGEVLVELAIAAFGEFASHRSRRPVLAAVGGLLFGVAVGVFSLWPLPHHLIHTEALRLASLVASPLVVGLVLGSRGWLGKARAFRGSSFVNGLLLAAAVGLVRYFFAAS